MSVRYIFVLYYLFFACRIAAQTQPDGNKVRYTPDFKFRDGIYLNFDQVKANKPIPKSRVLTSVEYNSNTFFEQITENEKFTYFDDLGNGQEVAVGNIWGYCKNGILYIGIGSSFNRITIVGSICHFVANVTSYNSRYDNYGSYGYGYNPYGYGYNPYGYSPYGYSPYGYSPGYRTTELKQFLLDFNTGKVLEYDNKNVEMLLMTDPELHDEYAGLRSKKKQQLRFMYIRKYNEKYPLFIPK
ncbi:MAG: hypothetical protein LBS09_02405 [Bacteroidales bacterium]|jgi:hypothetical protein|nr:hypothetical protein [Bacteroidales bacterium]